MRLPCYSALDRGAEYCDERVCLCVFVCPRSYLRNYTPDLRQIFCACYLWPWLGALCTSGFVADVIFAHKPRLLDVAAQLNRSAHAAMGLAITVRSNTSCRPTDARDYFSGA